MDMCSELREMSKSYPWLNEILKTN